MNKKIYIAPTTQAFAVVQQQMLATSGFDSDMTGTGDGAMLSNRKGSGSIWGSNDSNDGGSGIWK